MPSFSVTRYQELHSDEVHEIINRPPLWLARWGITMFFCVLLLIALGTWWVRYPDIVPAGFSLTAVDGPRPVIVRADGRLERLLVTDGQPVENGQAIAYSESTADHDQIMALEKAIGKLKTLLNANRWHQAAAFDPSPYAALGPVQNDFSGFVKELRELRTVMDGGFYTRKQELLRSDYEDLINMEKLLEEQMSIQQREFELAQDEFKLQEKLYEGKVIAILEYKKEKAKLLSRELPLKNLSSMMIQNRSAQTSKRKELLELQDAARMQKEEFLQAIQTLSVGIGEWKQKYVLVAPVSGQISFSAPWQLKQQLIAGQEFLTIEPVGGALAGILTIRQTNLGKIRVGQNVLIKLEGFPYREYGLLEGRLTKVSATPGKDSTYWGSVDLPRNLTTSYGHELPYRNGLRGSAEIVTTNRRLLERLITIIKDGGKSI